MAVASAHAEKASTVPLPWQRTGLRSVSTTMVGFSMVGSRMYGSRIARGAARLGAWDLQMSWRKRMRYSLRRPSGRA